MRFRREWVIGRYGAAPISVHWSALLAFPFAWVASGSVLGGVSGFIAYVTLILVHELGHAVVATANGLRVFSLQALCVHGECAYESGRTPLSDVAVAWGGVAAQFLLFLLAWVLAKATAFAAGEIPLAIQPAFFVWVPINLLIIFVNLLPIPPLDGAKAWRAIPLLWRRLSRRSPGSPVSRRRDTDASSAKVVSMELQRVSRKKER
jgi:stage IV sporulation protein FB